MPPDPTNFAIGLGFEVGPEGEPGGDRFYSLVCIPAWLFEHDGYAAVGAGKILVSEWRLDPIESTVKGYLRTCRGNTWSELAADVQCLGSWELKTMFEASGGAEPKTWGESL